MGIGKILLGVGIIVIGIVIWFSMFSDAMNVFVENPQERYDLRLKIESFQTVYFLLVMFAGIGIIVWGSQT